MSDLHRLILDALDMLGAMSRQELETACLITPAQRGGFNTSLNRLFKREFVICNEHQLWITPAGVRAIERANIAAERASA